MSCCASLQFTLQLLAESVCEALLKALASPGEPRHDPVAGRADLDAWARWLDSIGIANSGVVDTDDPMPYSVVVFRDPDNIQLELIYMAG